MNFLGPLSTRFLVLIMMAVAPTTWAQNVTVVEYYNRTLNAYFITGRATEQALLDTIPDFQRTGMSFQARAASAALPGQQAVCRYAIQVTPSFVSHFYGLTADCDLIASLIAQGRITNFTSEGLDFAVEPTRSDGTCNAGSFPVYRSLRLGSPVNVPNHRYSVILADYQDSIGAGYAQERAVFCVPGATPVTPRPDYRAWASLKDRCAVPRTGISPITGRPYPDQPGTLEDEKRWIRYWVDQSYLWWREVPHPDLNLFATPQSLFPQLKSFARAASGGAKDIFSNFQATSQVENANAGITFGYGVTWAPIRRSPPREFVASVITPGSPADQAGVRRGDRILNIDGVDFVNGSDVNTLNRGLSPPTIGESHVFVLQPADGTSNKTVTLTSAQVPLVSVPSTRIINTSSGRVGYIAMTTFNSFTTEKAIADAVQGLVNAGGVNDLVLDLRYNTGGFLYISSQLAYMIAGPSRTAGKIYSVTKTNDKKPFGPDSEIPFISVGSGNPGGLQANLPLPTLNLPRVFVLSTASTCSASESFINGLRGVDFEVIMIGSTTCGKPYGFRGVDNCGTTYYPIQLTSVNAKNEGDYIDGFAANCPASDDYSKDLGDPAERMLAAALSRRASGTCPASAVSQPDLKRTLAEDDPTLAVGVRERALEQMMLIAPPETRRDRSLPITPRKPFEVDDSSVRR